MNRVEKLKEILPKVYPSKDNYVSFEKYTNCEHKKNNEIGSDCRECDIAWLIERCRGLEKILSACLAIIEDELSEDDVILGEKLLSVDEIIASIIEVLKEADLHDLDNNYNSDISEMIAKAIHTAQEQKIKHEVKKKNPA